MVSRNNFVQHTLYEVIRGYFKQIYECIYDQFSEYYKETDRRKYNLIRVDSTIVSETVGKLAEGLNNSGKKAIKYSVAFDGIP